MAVNFYLDARVDKRGDAPIRVSVSIRGVRLLTSSGHKICPAKWDANRQLVRKGATNASGVVWSAINSALNKIRDHYLELEGDCIAQGIHTTVADLKADFARTFGRYNRNSSNETDGGDNYTIFDYIDIFIKEMGESNGWSGVPYSSSAKEALYNFVIYFSPMNDAPAKNKDIRHSDNQMIHSNGISKGRTPIKNMAQALLIRKIHCRMIKV